MQEQVFRHLAGVVLSRTGHALHASRAFLIESRLGPLARQVPGRSVDALLSDEAGLADPDSADEIAAALLPRETWFFRERPVLERLVHDILPARLAATPGRRLRVWCAGGGTGQEAYSLAMLLDDARSTFPANAGIDIVSTDLSAAATARARTGRFTHFEAQTGLPAHLLLQHFTPLENGDWQASDALRNRISFRRHNLFDGADGLGAFDVILCRHVLTGMTRRASQRVAGILAEALTPGGLVVTGAGENLEGLHDGLRPAQSLRGGWTTASKAATGFSVA